MTNLDASITEKTLIAQDSFQSEIGRVVDRVLYIVYASYRDYVSQKVRPATLVRESSTRLVRYLLDTRVRWSTYLLIFKSQNGSVEALNFLVITS